MSTRAAPARTLVEMLLDGEIDAAIVGDKFPDPRLKPLIPDAETANAQMGRKPWRRADQPHAGDPRGAGGDAARRGARGLPAVPGGEERRRSPRPACPTLDPLRFGIEANRRSLEIVIDFAVKQGLLPRRIAVDDLFDDTMRALG